MDDKGDRSQVFSSFLCQKQMHIEGANDAPVLHDVQNVFICTAYMLSTPSFYADKTVRQNSVSRENKILK